METKAIEIIKKHLSVNKGNVNEVELYISNVKSGGKVGYVIYMGNIALTDILITTYDLSSFVNKLIKKLNELKSTKGWGTLIWEFNEIDLSTSVWRSNTINFPNRIMLLPKPCAEFNKLVNFIKKYTNQDISVEDIYRVRIGGKRGRVYGEEDNRNYLAFNCNVCNNILDKLKKSRGSKDKITISKKITFDDIDPFELQYSIRNEVEFSGVRYTKYEINITTPSGRHKDIVKVGF